MGRHRLPALVPMNALAGHVLVPHIPGGKGVGAQAPRAPKGKNTLL